LPTRDVEISYKITERHQRPIAERVRWSASEHLERVDGPNKSSSIFDYNSRVVTLLNGASRTYRKLENAPRQLLEPEPGAVLKRGNDSVVAGLPCTDWSWTEDVEKHTVCVTPDGVVLRLVMDEGKKVFEARSVHYAPQSADLFRVPSSYAPRLRRRAAARDCERQLRCTRSQRLQTVPARRSNGLHRLLHGVENYGAATLP
jgi:hypothetical protein